MEKTLLDYIRDLTQNDTKTLSQKALKASEEVGELAKVTLPYDNAFATTHRFADKTAILEECADVFLCVKSISDQLGFSDEEFESMVKKKSIVWQELQQRELKVKYPIPFEIHVTIEEADIEAFKTTCRALDVKPILLDLHLENGGTMKDMMTSSTHFGENRTAYEEMKRIAQGLQDAGYKVIREKIETVPWHPSAPSDDHANPMMPKDCYFECHLAVIITEEQLPKLREICQKHHIHLSRNVFKKYEDGTFKIMTTYRRYLGTYEEFKKKVEAAQELLDLEGFNVEKEIIEFSVYDSKVNHDASWIKSAA